MNVVVDDAEEVWVKDTKSKKNGDRNSLGEYSLLALGQYQFPEVEVSTSDSFNSR